MEEKHSVQRQQSGIWRSLRDGDLEEDQVWAVLKDKPGMFKPKHSFSPSSSLPLSVARPPPSASRMIPKASSSNSIVNNNRGYSSIEAQVVEQSAPVNIPDWSKIYKQNSKRDSDEDGYSDEFDHKLPPHEFIARRVARSEISSFSVFEGIGRTLKGRDLSKVRNAVLTKTGFLESL